MCTLVVQLKEYIKNGTDMEHLSKTSIKKPVRTQQLIHYYINCMHAHILNCTVQKDG